MTRPTLRRSAWVVLPVAFMLAACGARLSDEERIASARDAMAGGDPAAAAIHLRNVLQADPSNVDARVLLAEAAFAIGDYDSAAKEYLRAIDLGADVNDFRAPLVESLVRAGGTEEALRYSEPGDGDVAPEAAYWRAMALMAGGNIAEATELLRSLRAVPELAGLAQVGLARIALAEGRPDDALTLLDEVAGELAGDADYWETRALAALQSGQPEDAVTAFRKGAEVVVDPRGTRQFMFRAGEAEALLSAGQLDEARVVASGLLQDAESHPVANYLMSRVELQSGDGDQALAYAQAVLAAQPESPIGHLMAGAASLTLGQTVQAERHLERAIASDPGNLAARKLLAQTRLGLQSPERALEALGPVLGGSGVDAGVATLAGMASVQAGDADAAVEIFRRRLADDPENDETRVMLAVSLMSAGRTEEALAELGRIEAGEGVVRQRADLIGIAAHLQGGDLPAARELAAQVAAAAPDNAALFGTLGAVFQSGGQLDEAAAWFEEALQLAPDNAAAAFNLGRIRAQQGQLDAAVAQFESILAAQPGNAAALGALAQIDWAQDRREQAIAKLERARAADAADASSRFILAQYLVALGRAGEAVAVAREAAEISPNAAPVVNALGATLMETGQAREALPHFERAREINPLEARYLFNAARAHAALGELDAGREQLVNALALEPDNTVMLATLVDLERRAGRLDAAARAVERLERAAPAGDARVAMLRGEVLLAQGRYAEAEQSLATARTQGAGARAVVGIYQARRLGGLPEPAAPLLAWLEDAPDNAGIRALLADHYLAQADFPAAIGEYERLVEKAPENPLFLNNLAWLYGEAGDPRGVELARRAHAAAPEDPMVADTLGWLLHQQGDNAAALPLMAQAAAGAPEAGDVRYRYAEVLAATGDEDGAAREARAVLADTGAANYHEPAQKLLDRLGRGGE
ncbi:XrtA/PEP-CTERM system TPR-repeat protein PrsT [Wenzhouxiangella sp. XN24]|uniref:XrtA/PEP-CTERM system TPR-repeat protein PrsT n=1 Tax=Wenzhouxiangella sp. XN24 TaxID=2713569 RepID=UPI0013EA1BC8|nr:XrtA/PEP-CTERM system TPR-repeat protein PrsT [Wenzhouxiangella sp. XN24]NGX17075.1 PEP-CTERM system TPR-repeat protein PrsT [Wenzhouxiangella sp. XN24]